MTDTVQQLAADLTREAQETGLNWVQELADRATALAGERRGEAAADRAGPAMSDPRGNMLAIALARRLGIRLDQVVAIDLQMSADLGEHIRMTVECLISNAELNEVLRGVTGGDRR